MVNAILAKRVNHIVTKGDNPAWPKGSKSRGFSSTLKRQGRFEEARYTIRYFQPDGRGRLKMDNGTIFKPNDRYPLNKEEFRLYYTSAFTDQQTIDVYVEDNFGQTVKLSFEFNSQKDEEKEKPNEGKR